MAQDLSPPCGLFGGEFAPRAVGKGAMFPSAAAAAAMATVSDLTSHFQVEPALWAAFVHEVGSLGEDIRLVAALPGKLVAAALGQASFPGDRPLTTIQAARVGLVRKLARRIMYTKGVGLWDVWTEEDPWESDSDSTSSPSRRPTTTSMKEDKDSKERTLKFTQVLKSNVILEYAEEALESMPVKNRKDSAPQPTVQKEQKKEVKIVDESKVKEITSLPP